MDREVQEHLVIGQIERTLTQLHYDLENYEMVGWNSETQVREAESAIVSIQGFSSSKS